MPFKIPFKRKRTNSTASSSILRSQRSSVASSPRAAQGQAPQQSQQSRLSIPPKDRHPPGVGSSVATSQSRPGPENDAEIDAREDNDALNEVVMALDVKDRGTVGCSYYVAREERMYFMEDVKLGGLEVVDTREFVLHLLCREGKQF